MPSSNLIPKIVLAFLLPLALTAAFVRGQGSYGSGGPRPAYIATTIPGATGEQVLAVTQLFAATVPLEAAVHAARSNLTVVSFSMPRDDVAIAAAVDRLTKALELMATVEAIQFSQLQASTNRLTIEQVRSWVQTIGQYREQRLTSGSR